MSLPDDFVALISRMLGKQQVEFADPPMPDIVIDDAIERPRYKVNEAVFTFVKKNYLYEVVEIDTQTAVRYLVENPSDRTREWSGYVVPSKYRHIVAAEKYARYKYLVEYRDRTRVWKTSADINLDRGIE